MRRRIVFSVAALIAVLATPSTTTPPEFKVDAEAVRLVPAGRRAGPRRRAVQPWAHVTPPGRGTRGQI